MLAADALELGGEDLAENPGARPPAGHRRPIRIMDCKKIGREPERRRRNSSTGWRFQGLQTLTLSNQKDRWVKNDLRVSSLSPRYTIRTKPCQGGGMMEPNIWPLDPLSIAALVARTIDNIDSSTEEDRDDLLANMLCAAWGSILAQ